MRTTTDYNKGWNSTIDGISQYTKKDGDDWDSVLEWAIGLSQHASRLRFSGIHSFYYYQGVIDCVAEYQKTGKLRRC